MSVVLIVLIVVVAVAIALAGSATFVITGRRRGRVEAPRSRPEAPPAPPPQAADPELAVRLPSGVTSPVAEPAPEADEGLVDEGQALDETAGIGEPRAFPETLLVDETVPAGETVPAEADDLFDESLLEGKPRFRDRLGRARSLFSEYLLSVRSRDKIDAGTFDELEEALILADVGVEVTAAVLDELRAQVKREGITSPEALLEALKSDLVGRLAGDRDLFLEPDATNVWLFVGVNGVGKTTTIGKIGLREHQAGRSVVMAAGDTFRAAAAEQLELWAKRVGAEVVRGNEGGDPGAVVFDAVAHAAARRVPLVLADTAGRLHTKVNLMEELKKIRRVAERPPGHVSEVLLVIDATTGQNGLIQAKQFAGAVGVTGVVLTKLDGTAKGGIALAIQAELGIPVKLAGLGEGPEDLVDFDPVEFVDALFGAADS